MAQTVVVGLGRSGQGAARLLQATGHPVSVIDSGQGEQICDHVRLDLKLYGTHYSKFT